jgi:hypothetical protein
MELAQLWAHQQGEAGPAVVVLLFIYLFIFFLVDFDLIFFFSSSFYSFLLLIYQSQRSIESFLFRVIEAEDTDPFIA